MIILIAGACGSGKTTITNKLSKDSSLGNTACLTVDTWLYDFIQTGFVEPWLENAKMQNEIVMKAIAASAKCFSLGGYNVFVEGVITEKMLQAWRDLSQENFDVRYIVLRPNEASTVERVLKREQNIDYPIELDFVRQVYQYFSNLKEYESHVLDTSNITIDDSVLIIKDKLSAGFYKI